MRGKAQQLLMQAAVLLAHRDIIPFLGARRDVSFQLQLGKGMLDGRLG